MSFELSDYQLAALQEMNITVWRRPESDTSETLAPETGSENATGANSDAQSRLQQLKAQINQPEGEHQAPVTPQISEPAKPEPVKPERIKLDEIRYQSFANDIKQALNGLECQFEPQVYISESLAVDKNVILLPATPEKLSVADKKALWTALSQLV